MKKVLKAVFVVLICYFIAVISNAIFLEHIVVSGSSMESSLSDGEFGLADKQFYKISKLDRFDIVVVKNNNEKIVKRVIGLPNEKIEYIDGKLFINDEIVNEDFIDNQAKLDTNRNGIKISLTLKEDEYFVLGDNRLNSLDSRNFGPVKEDMITSRVFMIYGRCKNLVCNNAGECECNRSYFWPRFI